MSRDWTPKEWEMMHEAYPDMKQGWNSLVLVMEDGTKVPLTSEEEKEIYKDYPKLNLIGADLIKMCFRKGLFNKEKGRIVMTQVESILNGAEDESEFADKVRLWYEGELMPGYYMDNNNNEMLNVIEEAANESR